MTVTRILARPLYASAFVAGGIHALKNADEAARRAKPVADKVVPAAKKLAPPAPIPTDPKTLVRINAVTQILAGLSLATGRAPRISALVLAASVAPTAVAGHAFWEEKDAEERRQERLEFFKGLSMFGGLVLAAVDTAGRPGLAWRARHAATDVRREARHMGKAARREAKLARKSL